MDRPLVSIIIVNYNGKAYLDKCLSSLKKQTYENIEIIFVDNGSDDGSVETIKNKYSKCVRIIENHQNVGFAKGNNIGILNSSGEHVVLLNVDTTVEPGWLEALVKAVESGNQIGMCASKIYLNKDLKIIDSTGLNIYLDGTSKQRGWLEEDNGQYDDKKDVLLPSGCAALYRRTMIDQIGNFDERYFAYCEDTDLGLRAQLAGWKCVFVPNAIVYHFYSGSWKEYPLRKIFLIERNRIILVFKLFPLWSIIKSYYYYLLRCAYHIYGIFSHKGEVNDYLTKISLWDIIYVVLRAHIEAFKLLPVFLSERIKSSKKNKIKKSIPFLLKHYPISVKRIALNE